MTWSILARDPQTGAFGVAVASRFFAVGALCPHARARRRRALHPGPDEPAVRAATGWRLLRAGDARARGRRCALIARRCRARPAPAPHPRRRWAACAAHTGAACVDWCGASRAATISRRRQHAGRSAGGRGDRRKPSRRTPASRWPSACSPRWRPAKPPAATSAASRRRRCASTPTRTIRARPARRRPRRAAARTAAPVREEPGALPALHAPACPAATIRRRASTARVIEAAHRARSTRERAGA